MAFIKEKAPKGLFSPDRVVKFDKKHGSQVVVPGMSEYRLPNFLQRAFFMSRGVCVNYYKAEAVNEKAVLIGCSGLKSDFPLREEDIQELLENGISILWIALPNSRREVGFFPYYKQAGLKLLSNPIDDIQKWLEKDAPKIFFGHSTGGQIFFHLMAYEPTFKKIIETCKGAILSAPYVLPASASSFIDPRTWIFAAFCRLTGNKLPSETFIARWWMKNSGFDLSDTPDKEYMLPTYPQIRELWASGVEAYRTAMKKDSNIRKTKMPIFIISGVDDKASCHRTNRSMARNLKLAFHSAAGKHGPISDSKKARRLFIESTLAMAEGTFEKYAEANDLYEFNSMGYGDWFRAKMAEAIASTVGRKFKPGQAAAELRDSPSNAPQAR